jgi:signal transduction histidine kinase
MQLNAAQRMKRMIEELLDFTRNRPGSGIPLNRASTDFAELLRISTEEIQLAHPEASLRLTTSGDCVGHWDADRLAQVCSNLIGNAIEHGTREVAIELRSEVDSVVFSVTNQGAPIPEAAIATLFHPFRRGQKRAKGGVGLGLHIVSQIALLHGGTIDAVSDASGTHFVVKLPKNSPPRQ